MSAKGEQAGGMFRSESHPALGRLVVEYWAVARDLAAIGGLTITPDGFGELVCCVDEMDVIEGGRRERLPTGFVVGLLDAPLRIEAAGVVRCMAARLRPWAVGRLFGEAAGRGWKDAGDIFGARLGRLAERVEARDWERAAAVFDEVLIEAFQRWDPGGTGGGLVGPFVEGGRPTADVADDWAITGRQVERKVRGLTGTSPKRLASLARFQRVRDAIWADPAVDLARLAAASGFADQAHMTRSFRRFAGQTPARFAREAAARKRGRTADDVANVQEPPPADG